ncbi:MAG TPA: M20/M25/M40 family metallo-hydrolase [Bryobacteraceae bacterium]|nr:M20/M25/M40 family metallo-hydrolase [Bryobacteraceae bacterium]
MATQAANAANSIGDLAECRGIREALQHFTREKQWVNDIHLQLCRIAAPTFHELPRAEWMAAQFRSFGWHAGIDSEGNVLASLDPQPSGSLVAITAHLDTVLAPRIKDDISFDPQGVLLGPGVSDNGAGLAGLLAIARAIQQAPEPDGLDIWRRVLLIANTGEEGEGNLRGIRHLCSQPALVSRILAFLILDGAALEHITTHALGSRRFEVTFSGPGGHSWSDFGIGNPVHAITRAITDFIDTNPLDPRATPRVSVNAGLIEGGSGINAIPAQARAKIDIRSEDESRIDALATALHAAVARAEETENSRITGGRVTSRIREIGRRPAGRLDDRSPLLAALRSVDAHLGIRARPDCASTDANIPLSMGIPAVSIGAGGHGGGAHTTSEWYRPAGRDLGLKRILLTAAALLVETSAP